MKNKTSSKELKPKNQPKKLRSPLSAQNQPEELEALSERLDMMLPEVMARIAAVEHVLISKNVCSIEDLLNARKFIDEQESF
jgi:Holliday junction resolvasome RuvABC endonuclease subunit